VRTSLRQRKAGERLPKRLANRLANLRRRHNISEWPALFAGQKLYGKSQFKRQGGLSPSVYPSFSGVLELRNARFIQSDFSR
jgi:hypothetical protein